ncbi:hypothetical protein GPECTOR_51g669 [Gonium pectorale]|uniref:Alpha-1,3-glucosyltransferase n=1 Tax=Gonium pectorale TaxID=33097 RepID=A0A150G769_GONPE|nr:hypothetical protein GPECTOR_51g669 [Gonium pectorale]|eukprot:KXZ45684.1 hypothetical protein GPECTOR_51g669 [Gonium pectorale]
MGRGAAKSVRSSPFLGAACLQLATVATAVKLLLVPCYRSTDFEVHRNWLAITHSLPISKWYVEATSEWTLDYPPLFAWFEWLLSRLAALADPAMLVVANLEYASTATVLFQRGSVIVTDLLLLAAAYALARDVASSGPDEVQEEEPHQQQHAAGIRIGSGSGGALVSAWLVAGVECVLLWSLHAARTGRHLLSGLLFAIVLNMKHLFLYAAPAYFVYLLRHYVMECGGGSGNGGGAAKRPGGDEGGDGEPRAPSAVSLADAAGRKAAARSRGSGSGGRGPFSWSMAAGRLALLGGCVLAVFAASFGPFIAMGQLPQLLRRLFPFGRGLLHAYWAANAWAPYAAADKLLAATLPRLLGALLPRGSVMREMALLGLRARRAAANMADGRVGVSRFAVLPQVTPGATAAAVLLALLPCLAALWAGDDRPQYVRRTLARALSYCFLCGFVYGYHVHEKAVLVALLPLAVDAVTSRTAARRFLLLSAAGHYGLLPLLFRPEEYGVKILLTLSYAVVSHMALAALHGGKACGKQRPAPLLGGAGRLYIVGFAVLELYCSVVHVHVIPGLATRLPFVPLMATSVYCSLGVLSVWYDMAAEWLREAGAAASAAWKQKRS